MSLRDGWEANANAWIDWARAPGHDSYWRYHRDQFLRIVPAPGHLTIDIGCGEGRFTRHLKSSGHSVIGIDASPSLVAAARASDASMSVLRGDAAALPLADSCADLAVAFMSLHDIDPMPGAVGEVARVLKPGGRFCVAIVHPINSAGKFEGDAANPPFVIAGDYLKSFSYADTVEREGRSMTFHSRHRSFESYFGALEAAGFVIEALREPEIPDDALVSERSRRWQRIPLFLHWRARRLSTGRLTPSRPRRPRRVRRRSARRSTTAWSIA
jgi:SAM-dependent methyltransferase